METEIDWTGLRTADDQRLPQYSDPGSLVVVQEPVPPEPDDQGGGPRNASRGTLANAASTAGSAVP